MGGELHQWCGSRGCWDINDLSLLSNYQLQLWWMTSSLVKEVIKAFPDAVTMATIIPVAAMGVEIESLLPLQWLPWRLEGGELLPLLCSCCGGCCNWLPPPIVTTTMGGGVEYFDGFGGGWGEMALFLSSSNAQEGPIIGTSWDGGVGGVWKWWTIHHHNLANVTRGINQRWAKLQKEMCVNSFVSIFVSLVQKAANDFFKTNSLQWPWMGHFDKG
jgi:hypothetical protein